MLNSEDRVLCSSFEHKSSNATFTFSLPNPLIVRINIFKSIQNYRYMVFYITLNSWPDKNRVLTPDNIIGNAQ
jgi:hypothetical protein